jgi:hypothetical protein
MALSGSRDFNPNLGEAVIAAFSRVGVRRTEVTQQHMSDAQMEANLLQSELQGDGIQLYQVVLQTQDLKAGIGVYPIDPYVVFMLDVYIRQNPQVYGAQWTNNNNAGSSWPYPAVDDTSQTWTNNNDVPSGWVNGSQVQQLPQPPQSTGTIDRLIMPISRSDYAAIANKYMTGFPTSFWWDRLLNPAIYLWPVPNFDVPDGLQYYVQLRPTNAQLQDGTQIQIPYQVYDYFVWALAERLAFIYDQTKIAPIAQRKQAAYQKYMQANTENTPINLDISVGSYFRVG